MIRLIFLFSILIAAPAAFADKLKIGVLIPLSGPLAEYGVAVKNGFELAKNELPAIKGNVEYIYEDTKYEGSTTLTAFKKLRERGDISIVYCWGGTPSQVLAPVIDQYKIPAVLVSAEEGIVKNRKHAVQPFLFYSDRANDLLIKHLRSKGYKRLGLVKTEMAFTNSMYENLKKKLNNDESLAIIDNFNFSDNDFRTSISKLKRENYDAIGVFLASGQIGLYYQQLAEQNLKPVTFGTDFFDSKTELANSKGKMEDAFFVSPYVDKGFAEKYLKQYGNDVQISFGSDAFTFMHVVKSILPIFAADKVNSLPLAYRLTSPYQGSSGKYEFRESDNGAGFDFPVSLKTIKDGEFVILDTDFTGK